MKTRKSGKTLWIILGLLASVVAAIMIGTGGYYYMQNHGINPKAKQLYQHGFSLYEQQIAIYIKENYSGVEKIEFSPIFIRRGGFQNAHIVPVIYDHYGNRELLGDSGKIENVGTGSYGIMHGLRLNRDGATNDEIIELLDTERNDVEVQDYDELPDFAKLKKRENLDNNISELVKQGYLKGVNRDPAGSPKAEVVYNLEIKEGDYTKWQ